MDVAIMCPWAVYPRAGNLSGLVHYMSERAIFGSRSQCKIIVVHCPNCLDNGVCGV